MEVGGLERSLNCHKSNSPCKFCIRFFCYLFRYSLWTNDRYLPPSGTFQHIALVALKAVDPYAAVMLFGGGNGVSPSAVCKNAREQAKGGRLAVSWPNRNCSQKKPLTT